MQGGEPYTAEELFKIVAKFRGYYGKNGGVTVSGGEPLLQAKALIPFFKLLKAAGIHTALDTNGRILNHFAKELMDTYTDLVMLDIKSMTEEGYQYITGQKNKETTFNVSSYREKSGKSLWLRYVLIPGLTDDPEMLKRMGEYFKDYQTIEKLEIQPYHKMGVHKWKELGWEYQLEDARENTEGELETAKNILSKYFREVVIN